MSWRFNQVFKTQVNYKCLNADEYWKYVKQFICEKLDLKPNIIHYGTTSFKVKTYLYAEFYSTRKCVTGVVKVFFVSEYGEYTIREIELINVEDKRTEKVMLT